MRVVSVVLSAIVATVAVCAPASAGVRRDDVSDFEHAGLAGVTIFDPVGQVVLDGREGSPGGLCSGTHIGDGWVVTAAHCFTSTQPGQQIVRDPIEFIVGPHGVGSGESTFEGNRYSVDVSSVVVHPQWSGDSLLGGHDIALFRVSGDASTLPATKLARPARDPVGEASLVVGYGTTGVGSTGWEADTVGTKRVGRNTIDLRGGQLGPPQDAGVRLDARDLEHSILLSDFDSPESTAASLLGSNRPLELEYAIAPGDSGGGLMVFGPTTTSVRLVGVHSFGASLSVDTGEIIVGDEDGFVNSSYGELQGYTEVSPFISDFIFPNTGIPEPATLMMLSVAAMGALARRRRA
jgi:hypothetical protein